MSPASHLDQRDAEIEARFKELLDETPIHRGRWLFLSIAGPTVVGLLFGGGLWVVKQQGCESTNRSTHKVATVIDELAADVKYPKGVIPSQRAAIDAANKVRRQVRDKVDAELAPDQC